MQFHSHWKYQVKYQLSRQSNIKTIMLIALQYQQYFDFILSAARSYRVWTLSSAVRWCCPTSFSWSRWLDSISPHSVWRTAPQWMMMLCMYVVWFYILIYDIHANFFFFILKKWGIPPKNFSLIWRPHHYWWRAANFDLCLHVVWSYFDIRYTCILFWRKRWRRGGHLTDLLIYFFWQFDFFVPLENFSLIYDGVTFTGEGLQISTYTWHSLPLNIECSLTCFTNCNLGHPFIMVISENL